MPIAPSGSISLTLANLQALVAACPSWLTWVQTADADADSATAAARIYLIGIPPEDQVFQLEEIRALRPHALCEIWTPERGYGGEGFVRKRNAEIGFIDSGILTLDLFDNVDPSLVDADDIAGAKLAFLNRIGALFDDMITLTGTQGLLNVHWIEPTYQGPVRNDQTEAQTKGDYFRVQMRIGWGV